MCRECGRGVEKTEHLSLRGVAFVEDLEQYLKLPKDQQKSAKLRVTFFGKEAQTLLGLSAAQVVAAEKDLWWYQVFFLKLTCGQYCFLARQSILFYGGFVVSDI